MRFSFIETWAEYDSLFVQHDDPATIDLIRRIQIAPHIEVACGHGSTSCSSVYSSRLLPHVQNQHQRVARSWMHLWTVLEQANFAYRYNDNGLEHAPAESGELTFSKRFSHLNRVRETAELANSQAARVYWPEAMPTDERLLNTRDPALCTGMCTHETSDPKCLCTCIFREIYSCIISTVLTTYRLDHNKEL